MPAPTSPPTTEQLGAAWEALADGFDRYTTAQTMPLAGRILDRVDIGPDVRVLDVGAGAGAVAIPAAREGAEVVAVDIAPTMIERLDQRTQQEGLSNVAGRVMDAQALDLDDDSFDVAVSLNGVTMVPDLARALSEMVRVTRPGGRVVVAAFAPPQKAEFIGYFMGALKAAVPGFTGLPMDPPPLPFRLADPTVFVQALTDAGARDVQIDTTTWDMTFESASDYWDAITHSNPIAVQLTADLTTEQVAEVQQVLDGMFRERSDGKPGATLHTEVHIGAATA